MRTVTNTMVFTCSSTGNPLSFSSDRPPITDALLHLPHLTYRDPQDPLNSPLAQRSSRMHTQSPRLEQEAGLGIIETSPVPNHTLSSSSGLRVLWSSFLLVLLTRSSSLPSASTLSSSPHTLRRATSADTLLGLAAGPNKAPTAPSLPSSTATSSAPDRRLSGSPHEVKKETRKHAGPQLKRQKACKLAVWAYEIRDELCAELARTQHACSLVSYLGLPSALALAYKLSCRRLSAV